MLLPQNDRAREIVSYCYKRILITAAHLTDPAPIDSGVTQLLADWRSGNDGALERLTPIIYDELRRLASVMVGAGVGPNTLQPTALVHEFYLRVSGLREIEWQNRAQFISTAAKVMRNLLVDHARRRNSGKRGGDALIKGLGDFEIPCFDPAFDLVDLDGALDKLAREYPRHARVVELVFFGGLNPDETAAIIGTSGTPTSRRTVERDWRFAKAWLQDELSPGW